LLPVLATDDALTVSISATTRAPRSGEMDGEAYYFMSRDAFIAKRDQGGFIEWAEVHGNLYGTPQLELERLRQSGKDVVLELDVQGMRNIRASGLDPLTIFILPPSLAELEQRLRQRGTDSEKAIAIRLKNAKEEIAAKDEFDHIIVNDVLADAITEFRAILAADRQSRQRG
jgi:guanylate kinase